MTAHGNGARYGGTTWRQSGVAMVVALGAIVVVGALVVSMFFASSVRGKISAASLSQTRAFIASDHGENSAFLASDVAALDSLAIGASADPVSTELAGVGTATTVVTRLQSNLFFLVTTGVAESPGLDGLTRRTGLLFRVIQMPVAAGDTSPPLRVPQRVKQRAWMHLF